MSKMPAFWFDVGGVIYSQDDPNGPWRKSTDGATWAYVDTLPATAQRLGVVSEKDSELRRLRGQLLRVEAERDEARRDFKASLPRANEAARLAADARDALEAANREIAALKEHNGLIDSDRTVQDVKIEDLETEANRLRAQLAEAQAGSRAEEFLRGLLDQIHSVMAPSYGSDSWRVLRTRQILDGNEYPVRALADRVGARQQPDDDTHAGTEWGVRDPNDGSVITCRDRVHAEKRAKRWDTTVICRYVGRWSELEPGPPAAVPVSHLAQTAGSPDDAHECDCPQGQDHLAGPVSRHSDEMNESSVHDPVSHHNPALEVDDEAGAWYVRLLNEPVARTTEQPGSVNVDWTRDGRMVGIELLSALVRPGHHNTPETHQRVCGHTIIGFAGRKLVCSEPWGHGDSHTDGFARWDIRASTNPVSGDTEKENRG